MFKLLLANIRFDTSTILSLPKEILLLLAGTFISRTAYYMSWPFLTIFLFNSHHISLAYIGLMITVSELISVFLSTYLSYLSDVFGRKKIMSAGCFLSFSGFYIIGISEIHYQFYIGLQIVSIARPMFENSVKAFISDTIHDLSKKELVFNLRYLLLNLGGVLGPSLGVLASFSLPQHLFVTASYVYLIYFLLITLILSPNKKGAVNYHNSSSFKDSLNLIINDRDFLKFSFIICSINIALAIVFISVPQFVISSKIPDSKAVVAILVSINTCTVVLLQYPISFLLNKISLKNKIFAVLILIPICQLILIFANKSNYQLLYLSTFLTSICELICVPAMLLFIDKMAPHRLRGLYYGISNSMISLCFSIVPAIGGFLISSNNSFLIFIFGFILSIFTTSYYYLFMRSNLD